METGYKRDDRLEDTLRADPVQHGFSMIPNKTVRRRQRNRLNAFFGRSIQEQDTCTGIRGSDRGCKVNHAWSRDHLRVPRNGGKGWSGVFQKLEGLRAVTRPSFPVKACASLACPATNREAEQWSGNEGDQRHPRVGWKSLPGN